MKKILAMVLALCLLAPCALSEEIAVYKSDKFLLQFPDGWGRAPVESSYIYTKIGNGKYDPLNGYILLQEIPDPNAKKGNDSYEKSYIASYEKEPDEIGKYGFEFIANDSIFVNGREKNVALFEAANIYETAMYFYLAFVTGDETMLMIIYGDESYRNAKSVFQEILESIIVR